MAHDLVVLYEHPEWQKPLFAALEQRGVDFAPFDLKRGAFNPSAVPEAKVYFNQASPSAYVRGNTRAVPLAYSLMRSLELGGALVLNGSRAFSLELSKSAQAGLMQKLGIGHPRTVAFNAADAALEQWGEEWPALLKPEQGGSGARMFLLHSADEFRRLLGDRPDLWFPDNLLMLQEYFPVNPAHGIVRMEFLDGELLTRCGWSPTGHSICVRQRYAIRSRARATALFRKLHRHLRLSFTRTRRFLPRLSKQANN